MSNAQVAAEVKRIVDKYMVWTDDKVVFDKNEHWTSWAKEVLELERTGTRRVIRDDCDGFALTSAALLYYKGVPKKDIGIAFVVCETGEGHLVCICKDGPTTWVLDNRQTGIVPKSRLSAIGYTWKSEMEYDRIGQWVKSTQ